MPEGRPAHWNDDTLERWKQAQFLTEFLADEYKRLDGYRQNAKGQDQTRPTCHYVLNIDSSWGLGKTFFLNRWRRDLEESHYLVLSFDAWANDFSKDPLLSFLSEIGSQLTKCLKDGKSGPKAAAGNALRWDRFKKSTTALLKSYGPSVAKKAMLTAVTASMLGVPFSALPSSGVEEDHGEEDSSGDSEDSSTMTVPQKTLQKSLEAVAAFETQDLFQEENSRKKAIEDFRSSLHAIVESVKEHKSAQGKKFQLPVFIFVDELDRCRPDFTIELIEVVKHIFSVEDIFFVFATDGTQMQAALEGTYGARFDAETYFNRIFTREIHLRKPDNLIFARTLIGAYGFEDDPRLMDSLYPVSVDDVQVGEASKVGQLSRDIALVADTFNLSLRDQDQLVRAFHSMAKFRSLQGQETICFIGLSLLLFWQQRRQLFNEIELKKPNFTRPSELQDLLNKHFRDYSSIPNSKVMRYSAEEQIQGEISAATFVSLLSVFLQLRSMGQGEIRQKLNGNNNFFFQSRLCEQILNGGADGSGRNSPVMLTYFDDVMMAG